MSDSSNDQTAEVPAPDFVKRNSLMEEIEITPENREQVAEYFKRQAEVFSKAARDAGKTEIADITDVIAEKCSPERVKATYLLLTALQFEMLGSESGMDVAASALGQVVSGIQRHLEMMDYLTLKGGLSEGAASVACLKLKGLPDELAWIIVKRIPELYRQFNEERGEVGSPEPFPFTLDRGFNA